LLLRKFAIDQEIIARLAIVSRIYSVMNFLLVDNK